MKKRFILVIILVLFLPTLVLAKEEKVTFSKCVDGDTIKIKKDNKEYTVRFLAIDTPETVKRNSDVEPYGKEASNYTCNRVKNAKKLILEYDKNSNETDKYGRLLAWVYTDGDLLQEKLVEQGYAEVAYLYGDYLYTDNLKTLQEQAKKNNKGMWSLSEDERDGCVIDGKIEKKSSGKCKNTSSSKKSSSSSKSKKKTTKKKTSIWDRIGNYFSDIFADAIEDFFINLF